MNPSFWVWLAFGIAALLVLVIWSIKRHRAPVLTVNYPRHRKLGTVGKAFPGVEIRPRLTRH